MTPEARGAMRHLLTMLGSGLVVHGYVTEAGLQEIINLLEVLSGAVLSISSIVWSIRAKRAASAEAARIAVKVLEADTTMAARHSPL